MVTPELRSRARRYGYTGQSQEKMLADLHHDGKVETLTALVREYERAASTVRRPNNTPTDEDMKG